MNSPEELIRHFYTCFQNKDVKGMQDCYADTAVFNDPVFSNLNAAQVRAMWEMLINRGRDLTLSFNNIQGDTNTASAKWTASYTFSTTGRKVVNHIDAFFSVENGKIVAHTDSFSFYAWARQAFGVTGLLIGWTPFLKNKVRKLAARNLLAYMTKTRR